MSKQHCENYDVKQETVHCYQRNVDRCCTSFVNNVIICFPPVWPIFPWETVNFVSLESPCFPRLRLEKQNSLFPLDQSWSVYYCLHLTLVYCKIVTIWLSYKVWLGSQVATYSAANRVALVTAPISTQLWKFVFWRTAVSQELLSMKKPICHCILAS